MKETKLNNCFRNPNLEKATADFLCKLFIEVNAGKMDVR